MGGTRPRTAAAMTDRTPSRALASAGDRPARCAATADAANETARCARDATGGRRAARGADAARQNATSILRAAAA